MGIIRNIASRAQSSQAAGGQADKQPARQASKQAGEAGKRASSRQADGSAAGQASGRPGRQAGELPALPALLGAAARKRNRRHHLPLPRPLLPMPPNISGPILLLLLDTLTDQGLQPCIALINYKVQDKLQN